MRLIDADKTLETLEELTEQAIGEGAALVKALMFAALKSESVVPTVGGWISVKDRLPERSGDYIIARQDGIVCSEFFDKQGSDWFDEDFGKDEAVTHWMPLPEPPEEVNE